MTSNEPPKRKSFRHSSLFLMLVSVASSFFLAAYVLLVGLFLAPPPESNTIEQTALDVANAMSQVNVASDHFGFVGLSDIAPEEFLGGFNRSGRGRVISINTLYGVLRLDAFIARELHHPMITDLLSKDFAACRVLEKALSKKIFKAVEKHPVAEVKRPEFFGISGLGFREPADANPTENFIYEKAYRNLASALAVHDSKLLDLTIKLGFIRSRKAVSTVQAPASASRSGDPANSGELDSTSIDDKGQYRAGVPVLVPGFDPIMFTPLLPKTNSLDPSDFVQDSRLSAPSAVLVEAVWEFRPVGHKINPLRVTRSACAAVGSRPVAMPPAALVINFPHGAPNLFRSVADILFYKGWKNPGAWRQATGGPVPGVGTLSTPSEPSLKSASPGDALATMMYHWMTLLEPSSNAKNCVALINSAWRPGLVIGDKQAKPVSGLTNLAPVNSVLARDTEARTSALLDQSFPDGQGQTILANIFSKTELNLRSELTSPPPSALPLFVDRQGRLNLAGRRGFDQKMVERFISAIYDTDLAALESLWVAKLMASKVTSQKPDVEQKVLIEKQELNSINNTINRLSNRTPGGEASLIPLPKETLRQIALLKEKVATAQEEIAKDEAEIGRLNRISILAGLAQENAHHTADLAYELCAHAFKICRNGIVALDNKGDAYLISGKSCFFACRKPLSESDFLEAAKASDESEIPAESPANESWLARSMNIRPDIESVLKNRDPAYDPLAAKIKSAMKESSNLPAFAPMCVVLDSQAVNSSKPEPLYCGSYPFFKIFIPQGQFIYYCQHAVETGAKPSVYWSVLIRDLVAYRGNGAGSPVNSTEEDWCKKLGGAGLGICPGLACEFQLRTPLPNLTDFPAGSSVSNEAGEQMPQIPPVPADML